MRTRRGVDALFPAVRKHVLATLVLHPERWWYATELARRLELPKTSIQRELVKLVQAGILRKRPEGKQVYYRADPDSPFLPELQGLMAKTAGLVDVVRDALAPMASKIDFAFVYGSMARAEELSSSDVDLMVVGDAGLREMTLPLRKARERLAREVHVTAYSKGEFKAKARAGHHFVASVPDQPKLFVLGSQNDLERAVASGTRGAATRIQAGARSAPRRRAAKPRRRAS